MQLSLLSQTIIPNTDGFDKNKISIQNRRFLGNKFKLISFIKDVIQENCSDINIICDIFSGTGTVGNYLSTPSNTVIFNDILKSSIIPIRALSTDQEYNETKINYYIDEFNNLETNKDNYFSINFGGKYFTLNVARKIGEIRELLEKIDINNHEKNILLTSLLYAVDKIANTVGHYDAYYKNLDYEQVLRLKKLNIDLEKNKNNLAYEEDANILIRKIKKIDLLYLDPPYNSRQYSDTYHLLENLIRWEKPEVFGKASKMDRTKLKSRYCLKTALEAFTDLIDNADSRYVLMSYNNTGDSRDKRSNNRITEEQILKTLNRKGKVKVFERYHKEFVSGNSIGKDDHKEILYFCKVTN